MKILNLYAGIGGNRKLWGDEHEITAVENDWGILKIYKDLHPKDFIVCGDAHQYLLEHFQEFDLIWSSPPCPTHSRARFAIAANTDFEKYPEKQKPAFPNMILYEEIIFLKHYFKGLWCVENVLSYYDPLITPQTIGGHYFWANFLLPASSGGEREHDSSIKILQERKGFNLSKYTGIDKRKVLRNCVEPEIGKLILNYALNPIKLQKELAL